MSSRFGVSKDSDDGKVRPQPGLASSKLDEGRFFQLIEQLAGGSLSSEEAVRRIMAHYHFAVGVHLRALGELRPEMIDTLVNKLMKELDATAAAYRTDPPPSTAGVEAAKPSSEADPPAVSGRKTAKGLMRDKLILALLIGKNHDVPLAEISDYIERHEPKLRESSLIAHLERMIDAKLILRPKKGLYTASDLSRPYFLTLSAEIERRGIGEEVLRRIGP